MNSGGAVNALSHFECDLFDLLSNAPYEIVRHRFRASFGRMRDFGARTAIFRRGARPRKARRKGICRGQTGQWVTPFRVSHLRPLGQLSNYIFQSYFHLPKSFEKFLGRKVGEKAKNYSIFNFENPVKSRVFRRTKLPDVAKISSHPRYDRFDTAA